MRTPAANASSRAGDERVAVDRDGAGVLLVQTGDDLAERALAGAVLAHEGVDLALAEGHGDIVERLGDAEALADVPGGEEGFLVGVGHGGCVL
jgi:hypothetical protein